MSFLHFMTDSECHSLIRDWEFRLLCPQKWSNTIYASKYHSISYRVFHFSDKYSLTLTNYMFEIRLSRPLDENERGEWKSWLKTRHLENEDHAIWFHHFMANGEIMATVRDFIGGGSKITADGDYSKEIKRHLLLRKKVMTNLTVY